jgi:hypothetical protein
MLDRGVSGFLYASTNTRRIRVSAGLRAQPLVLVNCTARVRTVPTAIRTSGRPAARPRETCCATATPTAS